MSIALSSVAAFTAAVAVARSVDLSAYILHPGRVSAALAAAARAGAAVRVRLERDPLDDAAGSLHRANGETLAVLAAAGADAALRAPGSPVLHMKAALVDGVAWLDDRNWDDDPGRQTVVRDSDAADVAALAAVFDGRPAAGAELRTSKAGALALETDLARGAGATPLALESESFGGGPVYDALLARARAGFPTRLLVAGREASQSGAAAAGERTRLAKLAGLGVEVRTGEIGHGDLSEKLAIAGQAAWTGSANATATWGPAGEQRDWGLQLGDRAAVDGLRAAFEANWTVAIPFEPPLPPTSARP